MCQSATYQQSPVKQPCCHLGDKFSHQSSPAGNTASPSFFLILTFTPLRVSRSIFLPPVTYIEFYLLLYCFLGLVSNVQYLGHYVLEIAIQCEKKKTLSSFYRNVGTQRQAISEQGFLMYGVKKILCDYISNEAS